MILDLPPIKYPIGQQSFKGIISDGYAYVDKTAYVYRLATTGKYYFLSRPRRFGKSLLLSTIHSFFSGSRELFKGLAVDSLPWEWKEHPVLHIDLNARYYADETSLLSLLDYHLREWEEKYEITNIRDTVEDRFKTVIKKARDLAGQNVVILVDEYDKPLFSTLHDKKLHNVYRGQLQGFYGVLKSMDECIRFAMLTGVTRFSKVSIFSGLNNIKDISLDEEYNGICGITEVELLSYFSESIKDFACKKGISYDAALATLQENYDGYHFSSDSEGVYNPFSLLNALASRKIQNYWYETGTPTFLVELLKRGNHRLSDLEGETRTSTALKGSDENLSDIVSVFFQTGYLTIKDYDSLLDEYTLDYPNKEVKQSLLRYLVPIYSPDITSGSTVGKLVKAVMAGEAEKFMTILKSFFADFPYDQIRELEVHFQNVVYLIMKLMGFYVRTEYKTSDGRVDMVIETSDFVYVIEFKLGRSPQEALRQIREKDYCAPFVSSGKRIVCIGAEFSAKTRALQAWEIVDGPL